MMLGKCSSSGLSSLSVTINGEPATESEPSGGSVSRLRRIRSSHKLPSEAAMECRVLVLHTGGTIGMMPNENDALEPIPNAFVENIRTFPELHDSEYARKRLSPSDRKTLVLPDVGEKYRVLYSVWEYDPLLDSSNMSIDDWMNIAKDIKESYEDFDGFVILHGTDTLGYTASALSFMLENLGKPVVVTGSQIPIFEPRTDGRDNFLGALIIAGNYVIPEVTVFFSNKLFRGNRTIKISSGDFDGFISQNFPPLVTIGIKIEVDYKLIFHPHRIQKFQVHTTLNRNVGLLRLFPSITIATVRAFLQTPTEGVVLQTYGAGNIPSNREDLINELKAAIERGVIIVSCTQCGKGRVSDTLYETGKRLRDLGVIPGADMTPEAALSKLSYVLSKEEWDINTKRQMMQNNLRGELSFEDNGPKLHTDLVEAVASCLNVYSTKEKNHLKEILYPAILCSMVTAGELSRLETYIQQGADLLACNADYRTPLHVACGEGKLKAVELFLTHGANVHMKDRFENTPLVNAIDNDRHDVIKLLMKCGAHLTGSLTMMGEKLCSAAARGHVKRLESYLLAKADLNQADLSGQTALHKAALHGQLDCVSFLLKAGANPIARDIREETPIDLARVMKYGDIVQLLESQKYCKCNGTTKNNLQLNSFD